MKRFFRLWLPPLAWMALIFFLSAQPDLPSAPGPWLDTVIKKAGHAIAYGILAWLFLRALEPHVRNRNTLRAASAALALIYALSDEYHQVFVPGRSGRLSDVAIDGAGVIAAMLLDRRWEPGRRQAPDQPPAAR